MNATKLLPGSRCPGILYKNDMTSHKEKILVTGASGFIGGWLAETIYLSGSVSVRAGIRNWSRAARLARFPIEFVLCDVMDRAQIAEAMNGVTCVIHCAKGSKEITIEGTRNMLDAALRCGVKRLVHLSTAEIYGNPSGEIDETFPYKYTGNPYGDSKIEAEKVCWDYYKKGVPVTVIRPSIVYGPFSETWTIRFAQNLLSGNWGTFEGYGEGICNLVYIADLVSAIMLAARHESAIGGAFNLNGPERITWNQYFQRFNAALGLPDLRVFQPGGAKIRSVIMESVRASAKFALAHFESPLKLISQRFMPARKLMKSAEKSIKTTPRLEDLCLFNRDAVYLTTKAQRMLGYQPRFNLERGLEMSVRWLEYVGLLSR
jgi:nucleoside-diphosphate-sugar epimerase